jgi:hypothetical protein
MTISTRRWMLGALIVAVLVAAWWWRRQPTGDAVAANLVDLFPMAEKRSNGPIDVVFVLGTQRIRGEAKRSIFMHPTSRLTYQQVEVPERASLRTWMALKEDAWDKSGDGVLFRVGVSYGQTYDELATRHVDPRNNLNDRAWVPLDIDLSPYEGKTIDLIFNTNASPPGRGNDPSWDFAVWGAPEIVIRAQDATTAAR